MENAIDSAHKDDDFVAILLLEPQSPPRRTLSPQQRRTQSATALTLLGQSRSLMGLPQAKGSTQGHDQQGKVAMDDDGGLRFLGEAPQVPGMLALLKNAILNHAAPVIGVKDHKELIRKPTGMW